MMNPLSSGNDRVWFRNWDEVLGHDGPPCETVTRHRLWIIRFLNHSKDKRR